MSRRAADRASGVKEPTWRRLERGAGVEPWNLYPILQTLRLSEEDARSVFDRVGFDFDRAAYQEPDALQRLRTIVGDLKRSTEEAEVVLARLEAEERERQ